MKTIGVGIVILTLVVISLCTIGTTHAYFTSKQVTGSHLISTWQSTFWTQTTQADFLVGVPVNVDTISNPGGVKLAGRNTSPIMYAIIGGATTAFHQYNVSNNTWNPLRNTPGSVSTGGAVADNNLNYLYVLRGGGTKYFYRYSVSSNSWSSLTQTPAAINAGGALASDQGNCIYAFNGSSEKFWVYNIDTNTWNDSVVSDVPSPVGWGGSLAFMPVSTYYQSYGTFASEVNNSGQAGTRGDIFEWDEIVASGITDITFEVRASDTSFTKADPLPSWISVGGTSPLRSGLPSGQFRQWRATLSTGNSTITPILNEVRLWSS